MDSPLIFRDFLRLCVTSYKIFHKKTSDNHKCQNAAEHIDFGSCCIIDLSARIDRRRLYLLEFEVFFIRAISAVKNKPSYHLRLFSIQETEKSTISRCFINLESALQTLPVFASPVF